ncbi:MAG: FAD-dependent oxidoreductase [Thiobacillaceae bacterium]|nr:FAD-dependent oxidoreductase [Thiobacillaceae bacterium]MCX7673419.1 FAD-dependent oxidoreductase [Thiobacillaceae bacterium]MDW8323830.1 FAD-dependent oxidoreductase [Burkholderiales bacterium]
MGLQRYEVVIVGAGVTGAALAYVLARYSDVQSIAVLEKEGRAAALNSAASQNSQTLHCGDLETNYTLDKAAEVRRAAGMVLRYVEVTGEGGILQRMPKMVLAVGEAEVELLRGRFEPLRTLFPDLRLLDTAGVAAVEPEVGRPGGRLRREPLMALARPPTPCAADFGALTVSLLRQAQHLHPRLDLRLNCRVQAIEPAPSAHRLRLPDGVIEARCVAVCAGAHSLAFAHALGHGRRYAILPVAGSFYHAPLKVRGKVYTVQDARLPFAAIHADPDITQPQRMRLGPTALAVPFLERRRWASVPQFLRMLRVNADVAATFAHVLGQPHLRRYALRNLLYELPLLGVRAFVREARKILPDLRVVELRYAHGHGGLRPQLLDLEARRLHFGPAKIAVADGLLFNITPSPGATSCLANAVEDAAGITAQLGRRLRQEEIERDLMGP